MKYWITRSGLVVEQRGEVNGHRRSSLGRPIGDAVNAYNVPSGAFRGLLLLSRLRPATENEVKRAKDGGL